jgi:nitroimidazol reductase NimA-like FMN-containing flavoprotein (pyridoxamine 5'-phosphate oxidase superfamily)
MNLKNNLKKFLKSQQLAVLATQNQNNSPYTNLIAFSQTNKDKELLFGTMKHTTKYNNIQKNNKVSILFDNRENTHLDFKKAKTVTAIGKAVEVDKKKYQDFLLEKHPNLERFIKNTDCALMMIVVDEYISIENFQKNINKKIHKTTW